MVEKIIKVLRATIGITETVPLDKNTPLLGNFPELDSMAVVNVLTELEEEFDIAVEDDEVSADIFETVGSLVSFIELKTQLG